MLLDDAYLQLAEKSRPQWQNRGHFFAAAAQLMRRIIVDHARARNAAKRGGGVIRIGLHEAAAVTETTRADELLALDEALEKLALFDQRKADVVEMRYFGGLGLAEIAGRARDPREHGGAGLDGGAGLALRGAQRGGAG